MLDGRVSAVDEEKEEHESRPLERGGVSHQGPQWWEGGATPLLKSSKIKGALIGDHQISKYHWEHYHQNKRNSFVETFLIFI